MVGDPKEGMRANAGDSLKTQVKHENSSQQTQEHSRPRRICRRCPGKRAQTGSSTERQPSGERHQNEGHGRRLTAAFEALEAYPALAESRNRLLAVASKEHVATADIVTAVESDVALIIAVLRLANRVPGGRGRVDTVARAVELLTAPAVEALAGRVGTFNFFERATRLGRGARALPAACAVDPARGRPDRRRGRLRAS